MLNARHSLLVALAALLVGAGGCAHHAPAASQPAEPSVWYAGSVGYYDYFHTGDDPNAQTNYRLPRGEAEVGGERFRLTPNPAQWRRVVRPAQPAPTTTGPAEPRAPQQVQ